MTETIRLYDTNAYLTRCEAKILEIRSAAQGPSDENPTGAEDSPTGPVSGQIALDLIPDQTVFFPEGGGQSADRGWVFAEGMADAGPLAFSVTDVQTQEGRILHRIVCTPEEASVLQAGAAVTLQIDWERRFGFMQNHTGEHILSGLIHNRYGFDNIGFHLSDNSVTLDVNGQLSEEEILFLEWEANEVVYSNLPVKVSYPSQCELDDISYRSKIEIEGRIRLVTIPDVDVCACCATHVRMTGEIGLIKIVKSLRFNGGMRLFIVCGRRALALMQKRQQRIEEVSHLTNRSQDEIGEGVKHLLDEIGSLKQKNRELEYRAAYLRLSTIPAEEKNVYMFVGEMDTIVQRNLVNRLCEEHEGVCGVFSGSASGTDESTSYRYIIGSRSADSREVQRVLREKLGAKGGGKPEMIQGSVSGTEEEIRKALV